MGDPDTFQILRYLGPRYLPDTLLRNALLIITAGFDITIGWIW